MILNQRTAANTKPRAEARVPYFLRKPITFGLCLLRKTKNHARWRGFVLDVTQGGFEPPTLRAEI